MERPDQPPRSGASAGVRGLTPSPHDRRRAGAQRGYRLAALDGAAVDGGTEVTECWRDQRGKGAHVLGRIFTGRVANNRAEANREGMRTTLARLKQNLEAG